eukprot:TRINITY_DN2017_c0_g1_i5.p1 TRINITY_DN2017_c0_g1~~TRINITY_DN2017_c0_g1_i5.p1  ORF type:complete len:525 (+),score=78.47 TRINITY_DN2017_c0_g1_i5:2-1576(+)
MTDHFTHTFPFLKEKIEANRDYSLSKEDLELIAQEISMNNSIQQFGIPYPNRQGTFSYSASSHLIPFYSPIFNALKLNSSITTFDLRSWDLTELRPLIAEVIMLNNTITDLNLESHPFGREVMNAIKINSTIQTLNLYDCYCDDSIFENTNGTSSSLTSLNIARNQFDFTYVAEWLKYNVNLKSLTLSGSQITGNARNAFYECFPKRSTLTELKIIEATNKFEGIESCLKVHGKLQRFTLQDAHYSSVTEEGLLLLESLSFNKDLHFLDLSYSLTDQEYSAPISRLIDSLPLLTGLYLWDCQLDNQISKPLKRSSLLKTLDLYNCFRDEDDMIIVCEALHDHPNLTWLNLGTNSCYEGTKNGVSTIAKLLQTQISLKSLYFGGYYPLKTDQCDDVQGMVDLVKVLKDNHTLTLLSLSGIQCKDKGAILLAECLSINNTLTELNLERNSIEDDGMIAIAQSLEKNSSLKTLDFDFNHISKMAFDSVLKMLDINTTLTEVRTNQQIPMKQEEKVMLQKKYGKRLVI